MNPPTNSAALPPMAGSLPPHKIVMERIIGSLNGKYYRCVHRDTGKPIVLGIIGDTRELARQNTIEALSEANAKGMAPGSAVPDSESINQADR